MRKDIIKYLNTGIHSKRLEGKNGEMLNKIVEIMCAQLRKINNKETISNLSKYGIVRINSGDENRSDIIVEAIRGEIAISQNILQPDWNTNNKGKVLKYRFDEEGEISQISYANLALESFIGDEKDTVKTINEEFSKGINESEKIQRKVLEEEGKSKGFFARLKKKRKESKATINAGDIRKGVTKLGKKLEMRRNLQPLPTEKKDWSTQPKNVSKKENVKEYEQGNR